MSATTIALNVPAEYGYVLLTATLSAVVAQWHAIQVGGYRKRAKVAYPNAYSPASEAKESRDKYLFNCAQRAHSNFLEHQPVFLFALLVGGLKYPMASAGMGVAWCVARVMYAVGYVNKNKENGSGRTLGFWSVLPEIGLQVCAGMTGYSMLMGQ